MGFINFPNSITERHVMCEVKTSFVFNLLMISFPFVQTILSFTKIERNEMSLGGFVREARLEPFWWICFMASLCSLLMFILLFSPFIAP